MNNFYMKTQRVKDVVDKLHKQHSEDMEYTIPFVTHGFKDLDLEKNYRLHKWKEFEKSVKIVLDTLMWDVLPSYEINSEVIIEVDGEAYKCYSFSVYLEGVLVTKYLMKIHVGGIK